MTSSVGLPRRSTRCSSGSNWPSAAAAIHRRRRSRAAHAALADAQSDRPRVDPGRDAGGVQEALARSDGDVSRMTTLVGMLLSLARADAGQLMPNREPVDLADLALDVADQLEPIASENGLTITTDLRPVIATVDADMIIQVLVNLIDNAITNTPSGGTITVKVDRCQRHSSARRCRTPASSKRKTEDIRRATRPCRRHCVRHRDRHCARALAAHLRPVLPGRYRAGPVHGGIGLGLAICQAIVHAHHGTLTATSQPGRGSTFTMTLPLGGAVKTGGKRRAVGNRSAARPCQERCCKRPLAISDGAFRLLPASEFCFSTSRVHDSTTHSTTAAVGRATHGFALTTSLLRRILLAIQRR